MERAAKERLVGAVVLVSVAWLLIPVFLDRSDTPSGAMVERQLELPSADAAETGTPRRRETVQLRAAAETVAPVREAITSLPAPDTPVTTQEPTRSVEAESVAADVAVANNDPAASAVSEPETEQNDRTIATRDQVSDTDPAEILAATADERPVRTETTTPTTAEPTALPPAEETPTPPSTATADGQLWAVQLGSFGDQSNAQKLAANLRADGLPAFISQVESGGKTLHRVRIGPHASRAESERVVARLAAAEQTARVVKYP